MDLFNNQLEEVIRIIADDGIVDYHGGLVDPWLGDDYFNQLLTGIDWQNDRAFIAGKEIVTKRKIAWHGDEAYSYTYSNTTKLALPWNQTLLELKQRVEQETGETYNACLLNLYHSGEEGMAWHSDSEKDLKYNGAIASLSFGAERKFAFKHKQSKHVVSLILKHGSLLVMKGATQSHWLHRLPPTKTVTTPRINLTFRTISKTS
jgi:alkylated DNA repair dioxygenase AlkB